MSAKDDLKAARAILADELGVALPDGDPVLYAYLLAKRGAEAGQSPPSDRQTDLAQAQSAVDALRADIGRLTDEAIGTMAFKAEKALQARSKPVSPWLIAAIFGFGIVLGALLTFAILRV